jgi:HlyD family secretion protein
VAAGVVWFTGRSRTVPPRFQTGEVTRGDLQVTVTATGTLQGLNTVEVGTEISGKIAKIYKDFNDPVAAGELIAEIDTEQLEAAVQEARAQLAAAKARIREARATAKEAKLTRQRAEVQAKQGLIARQELEGARATSERATAQVASAEANAKLAEATLESAESRLAKARIVSPIDGVVLSRLVEPGQTVVAGLQTPVLFKLTEDLKKMRLLVDIDEADVGRVREGQEATFAVDAFPERTFESRVLSLRNEPITTNNVVTYQAVLSASNPELQLRPGMTATVTIVADERRDVLLVPNAALRFTPPVPRRGPGPKKAAVEVPGERVYVLEGERPKPIPVKTGATDGARIEILEGELEPGTAVLTGVAEEG